MPLFFVEKLVFYSIIGKEKKIMKKYCQECGKVTESGDSVPKFCGSCGSPFEKMSSVAFVPAPTKTTKMTEVEDEEDRELPILTEIKIETDVFEPGRRGVKFEEVFGGGGGGDVQRPHEKLSKKKALSMLAAQGGTLRKTK
jgi:ribosomal protein L37E